MGGGPAEAGLEAFNGFVEVDDHDDAGLDGDAEEGDVADPDGDGERVAVERLEEDRTAEGEGHGEDDMGGLDGVVVGDVEEEEDHEQGDGDDEEQGASGAEQVFEFAAVFEGDAGREMGLESGFKTKAHLIDEGAEVTAADVGGDEDAETAVFGGDFAGAEVASDAGDLGEGHGASVHSSDGQVTETFDVLALVALESDLNGEPFAAIDDGSDVEAADAGFDGFEDVPCGDSGTGGPGAIDLDFEVGFALDAGGGDPGGPGHIPEDAFGFERPVLEGFEVVAEEFHTELGADAGGDHQHPVFDGLKKSGGVSGDDGQGLLKLGDEGVRGDAGSPFGAGFELDRGFDHLDRGGVGGRLGTAEFSGSADDFGHGTDDAILPCHDPLDFGE